MRHEKISKFRELLEERVVYEPLYRVRVCVKEAKGTALWAIN